MNCDGGWPDKVPASELFSAQAELARLQRILDGQGIPSVTLIGEFKEEEAAETTVQHLTRRCHQMTEHALAYKALLHDMQEKYHEATAETHRLARQLAAQRTIIGRLEKRLGIDDDL